RGDATHGEVTPLSALSADFGYGHEHADRDRVDVGAERRPLEHAPPVESAIVGVLYVDILEAVNLGHACPYRDGASTLDCAKLVSSVRTHRRVCRWRCVGLGPGREPRAVAFSATFSTLSSRIYRFALAHGQLRAGLVGHLTDADHALGVGV